MLLLQHCIIVLIMHRISEAGGAVTQQIHLQRRRMARHRTFLAPYAHFALTKSIFVLPASQNWELLMLATLQWNVNGTTAFDFVDHILVRVPWGRENAHIRQHAHTLVSVCCTGRSQTHTLTLESMKINRNIRERAMARY